MVEKMAEKKAESMDAVKVEMKAEMMELTKVAWKAERLVGTMVETMVATMAD